jgi:hypothetical protein
MLLETPGLDIESSRAITLYSDNDIYLTGNNVFLDTDIVPYSAYGANNGNVEKRWHNIFAGGVDIDMSGNNGAGVSGNIGVSISNISTDGAGIVFTSSTAGQIKLLQFETSSLSVNY